MNVRELCFIAVIASIEAVVFTSFSFILYVECITFTIVLFAMTFSTKQAVLGAVAFTVLNLSVQGVTPWSLMYCLIYPLYSLVIFVVFDRTAGSAAVYAHIRAYNLALYPHGDENFRPSGRDVYGAVCDVL